ncbi:MAG: hypothetical protein L0K82_03995 [Pisciglobus halotolerans]|nr:hypothetical protein [Pisciglobus halotolerans]
MSFIPGIKIDGIDLYKEFGILPESRSIGKPSKEKVLEKIPYSNHTLDFSELYGENTFNERQIEYTLNIIGRQPNIEAAYQLESKLTNILMRKSQFKLQDDVFPNYYFLVEQRKGPNFELNSYAGKLILTLDAYPFRISELPEGNNLWKTFNFYEDVLQETKFHVERTTFKPVEVGQYVTVGAWSKSYDGLEKIPKKALGETYKVKEEKVTSQSVSKVSYLLAGIEKWVLEQDIIQAQNGVTEINLVNRGIPSVVPKITSNYPVSIIFGNQVFNIWKGVALSEFFRLESGDNKMQITGNRPTTVEFEFYKELI